MPRTLYGGPLNGRRQEGGKIDDLDPAALAHALIVANGGGQNRALHRSAIDDVAVEEEVRVAILRSLPFGAA